MYYYCSCNIRSRNFTVMKIPCICAFCGTLLNNQILNIILFFKEFSDLTLDESNVDYTNLPTNQLHREIFVEKNVQTPIISEPFYQNFMFGVYFKGVFLQLVLLLINDFFQVTKMMLISVEIRTT